MIVRGFLVGKLERNWNPTKVLEYRVCLRIVFRNRSLQAVKRPRCGTSKSMILATLESLGGHSLSRVDKQDRATTQDEANDHSVD